jgi:CxC2 like cysteine cluster associated with KDZ transposases
MSQVWTGGFFSLVSLSSIGLVIPLGHIGSDCPFATTITPITVLHVNGMHRVSIKFCSCPASFTPTRRVQLLRARLFPATVDKPQTCATFELLRHSHILQLQSSISAYNAYHTLERLTDNAGITNIKVRVMADVQQ